ncbi:hypothetical protein NLG97_g4609 [Lecanicillium saksenae]|uniref:Uncharacterized protein n=1 Tax=Lecanicillium saksenae TaxID=468837 RepID=A0ACC1QUT9_9HYPO|nr:hypothetical protein NLG97_g4609 [Lecanicillium saksenae]
MNAISAGQADVVRVLLDWPDIDVNTRAADGPSALQEAVGFRLGLGISKFSPEIFQMLLEAGADLHLQDGHGWTPMTKAIALNNWEAGHVNSISQDAMVGPKPLAPLSTTAQMAALASRCDADEVIGATSSAPFPAKGRVSSPLADTSYVAAVILAKQGPFSYSKIRKTSYLSLRCQGLVDPHPALRRRRLRRRADRAPALPGPGRAPVYNLSVVADGSAHDTGNAHTSISLVDAPDYNAATLCDFDFELADGAAPPKHEFTIGEDGHTGQVKISPPTPVKGIKCQGSCVSNYGTCNGADGQGPKLCCNGFCAADKCRPWDGV